METFGITLATEPLPLPSLQNSTFQDFYQRHSAPVYRTALRVTGNSADAEDVMQTVFVRILNQTPRPDLAATSDSYMRRAATNAAIDILRQKTQRAENSLDVAPDHAGKPDNYLLKEMLRRALGKLKPDDAQLFVLRNVEGLSYDELAELFSIERGTVASRIHRIRETLMKAMKR